MADRVTPEDAARLAHYLEPGTGHTLTPARALRAVGLYLGDEDDAPRTPRSISAAELRDRMGLHKDAGRDAVAKYLDLDRERLVEWAGQCRCPKDRAVTMDDCHQVGLCHEMGWRERSAAVEEE